jgi:mRNA interferase RelE/StbE
VKVEFRESFAKDLKSIRDKSALRRTKSIIETVEKADSLTGFPNLKKLKGHSNYYRLRIGDYRIGIALQENTIVFVRILDRKDIYRYFP